LYIQIVERRHIRVGSYRRVGDSTGTFLVPGLLACCVPHARRFL
jgi:hypothetical protein